MYVRNTLGEFIVPNIPEWVPAVRYRAEPPTVIRGAMNPWQQERQRVLWMAEEAAWKQIQILQGKYRILKAQYDRTIDEFNAKLAEFENLIGKKSGIQAISKYGGMAGLIPGFQLIGGLFTALGFITGFFSNKKKKAERLANELQSLQARLVVQQQQLERLVQQTAEQVQTTERTKAAQAQMVEAVREQSSAAYATKQAKEAFTGLTHEQLALTVARMNPTRQGGHNAL